ncbi:MAG: FAD/NAD(P)-binding protein [candidate division KSB1 bacterium]|nr:FAD/NAD(P)-binding protein [candidate division KSB1 bacterium]
MSKDRGNGHLYMPRLARVIRIADETYDTKTFTLRFVDEESQQQFSFRSGQFVEVSVFGAGEAPFGLASNPNRKEDFDITVRAVGRVTRALHERKVGDVIGVRGPLGNYFPFEEVFGYDILIVGGGIGLPPLRSLIEPMLDARDKFGRIIILYGARTPQDRVYKHLLSEWEKRTDIEFLQTVDVGDSTWTGHVGVVTTLFDKITVDPARTVAFTCGPPIMIKFVIQDLLAMGFDPDHIISTLERYMKCGVGKCGHCAINHKYVCTDGPVFSFRQMQAFREPL